MSRLYTIDLQDYCNHRLIYDDSVPPECREGLDGIYLAANDLRVKPDDTMDGVDFAFHFGTYDNVVCAGQKLPIGIQADRLHMIGFAYWGNTNEVFAAEYADGSVEYLKIPFVDWSCFFSNWWMDPAKYGEVTTVRRMLSSGKQEHLVYFHHSVVELDGSKVLERLVFPDNFWVHVFAVTLEDGRSDKAVRP